MCGVLASLRATVPQTPPTYLQSWTVTPRLGPVRGEAGTRAGVPKAPGRCPADAHIQVCIQVIYIIYRVDHGGDDAAVASMGQPGRLGAAGLCHEEREMGPDFGRRRRSRGLSPAPRHPPVVGGGGAAEALYPLPPPPPPRCCPALQRVEGGRRGAGLAPRWGEAAGGAAVALAQHSSTGRRRTGTG